MLNTPAPRTPAQMILGYEVREFDGEPCIRDIDLARRLGFSRPRKIRDLIESLMQQQILKEINVRTAAGRTSRSGGRPAGREYWLDERAALKVAAKSETLLADAILDEVITVFLTVRRAGEALAQQERHALMGIAEQLLAVARRAADLAIATPEPRRRNRRPLH